MDDFQSLARIHAARPALPTILITDHPDKLEELPNLAGIYPGVFTKRCEPQELLSAVSDVLGKSYD
jgi:hypothetical protein